MPVYMVFHYDIADPEKYAQYAQKIPELLLKYNIEVLSVDHAVTPLEGQAKHAGALLKFDSAERADAFYNDPDYRAIAGLRIDGTANGACFVLHGGMPGL